MQRITDLFGLEHKPLRPPRKDFIGEGVFASMWEVVMQREPGFDGDYAIEAVLNNFPRVIEQRHASVLASVVCWLGTNCGRCFLSQAKTLSEKIRHRSDEQYMLAWTIENHRRGYVNSGIRTLEYCLATEYRPSSSRFDGGVIVPVLSADDYEVVEHLMYWLAGREGQALIYNCEAEIERLSRNEREKSLAEWKRKHQPEETKCQ